MFTTMAKVKMETLKQFIGVFSTAGAEQRKKYNSKKATVFADVANPGQVYVIIDWEDKACFEAFLNDPMTPETMKSGGAIGAPEFTVISHVASFEG